MSVRTYNPSVRVGNWNEDIQLEEDTLKDFLGKRGKGQLLLQKTENIDYLTQPVNLSISRDGMVHYGDQIMVVNKSATDKYQGQCSLSLNITTDCLLYSHAAKSTKQSLSGCPGSKPITRNLFVVKSPIGVADGEPLRYNEPFYLCMSAGEGLLYLNSDVSSFENSSKKARHNNLSLVQNPSFTAQFEVSYFDPRLRIEFEHQPVPANERVIITHQKTNQALAVEAAHKLRTPFGWEWEVSCHTYLNSHKMEEDINHFIFMMQVPGDNQFSADATQ